MTVERLACATADCKGSILPTTAAKTGGICMPCFQKQQARAQYEYNQAHKKIIDPYEGINDLAEVVKIYHTQRPYDPLIEYLPYPKPIDQVYCELSEDEQARLVSFVLDEAATNGPDHINTDICMELAAFCNADLSELLNYLVDQEIVYPGFLFKNANERIVNTLIRRLDDNIKTYHILIALAWAGTDAVVAKFAEWQSNPPVWMDMHPSDYSMCAGWIVSDQNQKQKLYLDQCYPLLPSRLVQNSASLLVCTTSKKQCAWCHRNLTRLLLFYGDNPIFDLLAFTGEKLAFATCDECSRRSDALFMDVTERGGFRVSDMNKTVEHIPDGAETFEYMRANSLMMSTKMRPADYAVDYCYLRTSFSQVGGMPSWVQDDKYPDCPKCLKKMIFVAQIDSSEVPPYGEGVYYNFLCSGCKMTATICQYT